MSATPIVSHAPTTISTSATPTTPPTSPTLPTGTLALGPTDKTKESEKWNWPMIMGISVAVVVIIAIIIAIVWYVYRSEHKKGEFANIRDAIGSSKLAKYF